MPSNADSFAQDNWTETLIKVFNSLVKAGALAKKKDFCSALGISAHFFHLIERNRRNYPKDDAKRQAAEKALQEAYHVNPFLFQKKSDVMFLREPKVVRKQSKEEVDVNFYSGRQKQQLQLERDQYKARAEELEAEVAQLQEELFKYRKANPDKSQDKKRDKK